MKKCKKKIIFKSDFKLEGESPPGTPTHTAADILPDNSNAIKHLKALEITEMGKGPVPYLDQSVTNSK